MTPPLIRLRTIAPGAQFLRFAAVGATGFVIDAAVLLALVDAGWAGPIGGRLLSFACAVLATFELNRRWSFRRAAPRSYPVMLAGYVGVQGIGFLCNLAIYAAALLWLPTPLNTPLPCLALASGCALVVNFAGARALVFRERRSDPAPGEGLRRLEPWFRRRSSDDREGGEPEPTLGSPPFERCSKTGHTSRRKC